MPSAELPRLRTSNPPDTLPHYAKYLPCPPCHSGVSWRLVIGMAVSHVGVVCSLCSYGWPNFGMIGETVSRQE
jgi:hypothetical protein